MKVPTSLLVLGRRFTAGAAIFLLVFLVYLLTLNSVWATDHATSFLQLDWAILAHHTFVLGTSSTFKPNSVDDFMFSGNYYSALAPGTAILALPFVGWASCWTATSRSSATR